MQALVGTKILIVTALLFGARHSGKPTLTAAQPTLLTSLTARRLPHPRAQGRGP